MASASTSTCTGSRGRCEIRDVISFDERHVWDQYLQVKALQMGQSAAPLHDNVTTNPPHAESVPHLQANNRRTPSP